MRREVRYLLALVLLYGAGPASMSAAEGPPFIAHLSQGTVELVGVTGEYRPSNRSRWWRPDGPVAPIGPFSALQKYHAPVVRGDDKIRTFLVRFENLPAAASTDPVGGVNSTTTPRWRWGIPGARNWVAGYGTTAEHPAEFSTGAPSWNAGTHLWEETTVYDVLDAYGKRTLDHARVSQPADADGENLYAYPSAGASHYYKMFTTEFAGPARATDLRIGVSMGEWETVIRWNPDSAGTSSFRRDGREWTVTFSKASEANRASTEATTTKVTLKALYTYGQWTKRLVAEANDGSEHVSSIGANMGGDNGEAVFRGLPLSSIKEFRLQVRPYHCVEFDNISLQPGCKAQVRVVSADVPEASQE